MPKYSYDHVHLFSTDPLGAAKFYEHALNAKRLADGKYPDGNVRVELNIEGTTILIRSPKEPDKRSEDNPSSRYGLEHFGLCVDDIKAAVADLKEKGVQIIEDIQVSMPTGVKIAFIMAPDNVMIELVQR